MGEWQPPPWSLTAENEWVFSLPPYRGILIMMRAHGSDDVTYFQALVEMPEGVLPAPQPFDTIRDAQTWVEGEIYRQFADSGRELRRHSRGRRTYDRT